MIIANEFNVDELLSRVIRDERDPQFIVVDLFCGAGGTTTGIDMAKRFGLKVAKVIACVNHDPLAIKSHWENHPDVFHFEEDIRTLDLAPMIRIVQYYREMYPNAFLILWGSLECTNFSKAKGGQPRDADSRTLADHLERYIIAIQPDYVQIENVVEFMSWGPLDDKGKPVSRKNGEDFMRWRKEICAMGYRDEWKELNSANFGAYTSRNRLFGIFARPHLPIIWPEPTHSKNPVKESLFNGSLQKWKAVKDVLDFDDEGLSIFNRKKPLSDKTFERIYAGLIKYVAKGDRSFISKYYSGRPAGKNISVDGPAGTVTTVCAQALAQPQFLLQTYAADSKGHNTFPVDKPARTITTRDATALVQPEFIIQRNGGKPESKLVDVNGPARTLTSTGGNQELVQPEFLACYYGNGDNVSGVDQPSPTIVTKDRIALVQPEYFIDKHFGAAQNQSVDAPAGVVMPNDKHRLVEAVPFIMPTNYNNGPKSVEDPSPVITANRKHHYLVNPSWYGNPGSVEEPCCVIVARQDKAPLYLILVDNGEMMIPVYEGESEIVVKIKQFMAVYGLADIKMRMLRVLELLKIQGFPAGYQLAGNQSDQKKFIGNSVVPDVVKAWYEAMAGKLFDSLKKVA